jgi:cation transport ATPase
MSLSSPRFTLAHRYRLSRRCRRTIYLNFAISLAWTAVMVAAAAMGLLGVHGAVIAAVLQDLSSVIIVINAGRLLKFQELLAPMAADSR